MTNHRRPNFPACSEVLVHLGLSDLHHASDRCGIIEKDRSDHRLNRPKLTLRGPLVARGREIGRDARHRLPWSGLVRWSCDPAPVTRCYGSRTGASDSIA